MVNFCENCGGAVRFSAKDGGNKCEVCGHVNKINSDFYFGKKPFDDSYLEQTEQEKTPDFVENVKCSACGANLKLTKYQLSNKCPYCGNIIETEQSQSNIISVDSIIPFHLTRAQALKKLKKAAFWRISANKKLLKNIKERDLVGVYANTFCFDINAFCRYSGIFSYTEKDKEGTEISSQIKHKHVVGMVDKPYRDILIEANYNLEQRELLSIMPYDFGPAFMFREEFMQGYMLQNLDKPFADCVNMAEKLIKEDLKRVILKRHNCDEVDTIDMQLDLQDKKYNYCLVPIYFVETTEKYKKNGVEQERKVKVLINGETGKVGTLPKNPLRWLLWLFSGCAIIVALILFFIFVI